jgi:hypothetical protein
MHSGRKDTPSLSYLRVTEERKIERARCKKACVRLQLFVALLISTQSVAFLYADFHTALYFVNQSNYKALAMQAHTLTRTHFFRSLNALISHPIAQGRAGLSLRMHYPFVAFPSLPSELCIYNGH